MAFFYKIYRRVECWNCCCCVRFTVDGNFGSFPFLYANKLWHPPRYIHSGFYNLVFEALFPNLGHHKVFRRLSVHTMQRIEVLIVGWKGTPFENVFIACPTSSSLRIGNNSRQSSHTRDVNRIPSRPPRRIYPSYVNKINKWMWRTRSTVWKCYNGALTRRKNYSYGEYLRDGCWAIATEQWWMSIC